jgi:hypothetical protein
LWSIQFTDVNKDLFPRDATDPDSLRKKERYLDFGLFTNASGAVFQKIPVRTSFENVHYNQFSQQNSKVNDLQRQNKLKFSLFIFYFSEHRVFKNFKKSNFGSL